MDFLFLILTLIGAIFFLVPAVLVWVLLISALIFKNDEDIKNAEEINDEE